MIQVRWHLFGQTTSLIVETGKGLKLNPASAQLTLSPIFLWKEEEIIAEHGSLINYILTYMDDSSLYGRRVKQFISQNAQRIQISYFAFEWELNSFENSLLRSTSFW